MIISKKVFPAFLLFSALGLASVSAYFSIVGISSLFSGAFVATCIMALFLEIGKIASVSFAYRYWKKCRGHMKAYLVCAITVLMLITSLGVSGMLMFSYQKSSIEYSGAQDKIKSIENQKTYYQDRISASKQRLENLSKLRNSQEERMSQVLTNEYISRNPLQLKQLQQQTLDLISSTDKDIKDENTKMQESVDNIAKIEDQVNQMKIGSAAKKDIQTFRFVANALNMTLDQVAKWFIILIIFVFDPLAVMLILAYNVVVHHDDNEVVIEHVKPPFSSVPSIPENPKSNESSVINNDIIKETKAVEVVEPTKAEEKPQPKSAPPTAPINEFFKSYFKM